MAEEPKQPRRRAKRSVEYGTRKKLGYRTAERCTNCQWCYRQIEHRKGKHGRPRKSVIKVREVRTKYSVHGKYAEGVIRKVQTNWFYACHLMGGAKVTKNHVCNFHLPTDTPIQDKPTISAAKLAPTKRQREALEVLDATLRKLEGGVPERPRRPATLEEIRGSEVPEHLHQYVEDHWEIMADEMERYYQAVFKYRKKFAHYMAYFLEKENRDRYMQWCFGYADHTIADFAHLRCREDLCYPPKWNWPEVERRIKEAEGDIGPQDD